MDVVILTVIPPELEAARRVLQIADRHREKDPDGTVYFRGMVRSELVGRDYSVALTCIGGAGNPGAAAATRSAIARYSPRAVLLMGIAAGIREKTQIGEVVLSDRVVAYESAVLLRTAKGTKEQPRPEIDRAPHTMIQDVVNYRPEPHRLLDAFARAGGEIPLAPPGQESEFRAHVASSITARQGTIGSGEKLLRDPEKLLAVRELHGKTEVGEMEAAGLVEACRRGPVPWLVIRGISDFGDDLKDDRFHMFASCAAAAVLHDFLAHGLDLGAADEQRWLNPGWTHVKFDEQEDLRAALSGDSLGPRHVAACPFVPEVDEIIARIRRTGAAAVVGESGSGKSMAVWHAAYLLHRDGWRIYVLSNPNASAPLPQATDKALYVVDDAQAVFALPMASVFATSRHAILVASTAEVPGFRNSIRLAPKRAVDAIASAFKERVNELLPILQSLDSRIGDRFLDIPAEQQIEYAQRSSETPWQFMFNLSSGQLRLKHKLEAVKGSPPHDIVLFCIALGQLASRGRPCSLAWLNTTVNDQTNGRIGHAENLLGSLNSHLTLLRNAEGVATPHARVAGVVLRAMISGKEAEAQRRRDLVWAVLEDESFPIAGALWLIEELPGRWRLPPPVRDALARRCLRVSAREWGDAGHVLGRLIGMLENPLLIEEVSATISAWLRACTGATASGIADALNSMINLDHANHDQERELNAKQSMEQSSSKSERREYAKSIVRSVHAHDIATKINHARLDEAYLWAYLLGRLANAADADWAMQFTSALDEQSLLTLCAHCPVAEIDSVAGLIYPLTFFSEDLALRMTEEIVPSLAEAMRKDLVGMFNNVRDLLWWTLRFGPKEFLSVKPDERRERIAATLVRSVGAPSITTAIAAAKPRDWHVLSGISPLVTRLAPEVAEEVGRNLDVELLAKTLGEIAAESLADFDQALVTLYLTKDGQPAARVVEQVCVPMNCMTTRAVCISPQAAVTVVRAGGVIDLELKGGLPHWQLALLSLASVYQRDHEAARLLLRSNISQLADALIYRQSNGGKGASRFIDAVGEFDPSALTDAMHLVDVSLAKQHWPERAQGSPEERRVMSRLLALAKDAGGQHGQLASTITCEPLAEGEGSDADDDEG